ncbi:MAG: hypothetical protein KJ622_15245 [Alphaproteobacteria bacterium]|nr:hypothetical protein [Alphaproteobacteria bacterium]
MHIATHTADSPMQEKNAIQAGPPDLTTLHGLPQRPRQQAKIVANVIPGIVVDPQLPNRRLIFILFSV